MVLRNEVVFFGLVLVFALAVSLLAYFTFYANALDLTVRLLALNGYIAVSIAAVMTPFLKEITLFFKKPFTKVHHYFAAVGLTLLTVHSITAVVLLANPFVLLPNVASIYLFFAFGGSVALIALYVAFVAVLLRRKIAAHWRPFHALMYLALFFGVVHANLLGPDFLSWTFKVVFDGLFAATMVAFALKRLQFYLLRQRIKRAETRKV